MDNEPIENKNAGLAYALGRLRATIRAMSEGEAKATSMLHFKDLVVQSGLDIMSPGYLRDAFLQGSSVEKRRTEGHPKYDSINEPKIVEWEPKRIVFCADGTGNGFDVDTEGNQTTYHATNVLKLFRGLDGEERRDRREGERALHLPGWNACRQIAKYLNGIGNDENWLFRKLDEMTGRGLLTRLIRGYTFISRHYEPGAQIVLVGFSRGAYTVRALADWVAVKGTLDANKYDLRDRKRAYMLAAASLTAWQRYRAAQFRHLMVECKVPFRFRYGYENILATLPWFFREPEPERTRALVKCVAVWDTVGALGLWLPMPEVWRIGRRHRARQRPDNVLLTTPSLHENVHNAWHAVSLDADRLDFTPSLWNRRAGVVQRLFPGVHSDVGGGYEDCGLSDISLQ